MKLTMVAVMCALCACTGSGREKAINSTFAGLEAAQAGFESYDSQHELDIVKAAPDRATSDTQLAAYRAKRTKVQLGFVSAFNAVRAAIIVNDDQSVSAMVQAAKVVMDELNALGVKL